MARKNMPSDEVGAKDGNAEQIKETATRFVGALFAGHPAGFMFRPFGNRAPYYHPTFTVGLSHYLNSNFHTGASAAPHTGGLLAPGTTITLPICSVEPGNGFSIVGNIRWSI